MTGASAIATIATGDYIYGAAALANSLIEAGVDFPMRIYADDRALALASSWARGARAKDIAFEKLSNLPGPLDGAYTHPTNLKARAILHSFDVGAFENVIFMDADVVASGGAAKSLIDAILQIGDPVFSVEGIRARADITSVSQTGRLLSWLGSASIPADELPPLRRDGEDENPGGTALCAYINAGFCKLSRRDGALLRLWDAANGALSSSEMRSSRDFPFLDQDVLNALMSIFDIRYASVGPSDILFTNLPVNPYFHMGRYGEPVFVHFTGGTKPWRLCSIPRYRPGRYEPLWYRSLVLPSGLSVRFDCPWGLRQWFCATRLSRLIVRIKARLGA